MTQTSCSLYIHISYYSRMKKHSKDSIVQMFLLRMCNCDSDKPSVTMSKQAQAESFVSVDMSVLQVS